MVRRLNDEQVFSGWISRESQKKIGGCWMIWQSTSGVRRDAPYSRALRYFDL